MAIIGYLGKDTNTGVIFQVSRRTLETIKNWKWNGSAKYATHQRHGTHALTEFVGLNPDTITFDITLSAELGVDPNAEIVKLWVFEREATPVALTVGTKGYGKYRWNVVSHKTKMEYTDASGMLYSAVVSVSLQEYLKD